MKLPDPQFWKDKRVLVTGGHGFKGTWLVKWLIKMGSIVKCLQEEICDRYGILLGIKDFQPEIVIHLAAISTVQEAFKNPILAIQTNVVGTTTLLECLRGIKSVRAILNVTTDKVYHVEGIDRGYTENDALGGLEMYAISKACSELVSGVYQKTYKLPLATARAGNVLGGGDWKDSRLIPNYYKAYCNHKVLDVNVNAIRPWQYVLDALCGYLLLCEKLYDNTSYVGAWNFASNEYESRSVQWVVDELNKYFVPAVQYNLIDDRGYYETKTLKLNSEKSHKALGWMPKYDMNETIRRTALHYIAQHSGTVTGKMEQEIDEYMGWI